MTNLQQTLVVMTQHQEEKINDILNLIKGQGHQQATQPQPSDSSTNLTLTLPTTTTTTSLQFKFPTYITTSTLNNLSSQSQN
jgi:hypothetical protein